MAREMAQTITGLLLLTHKQCSIDTPRRTSRVSIMDLLSTLPSSSSPLSSSSNSRIFTRVTLSMLVLDIQAPVPRDTMVPRETFLPSRPMLPQRPVPTMAVTNKGLPARTRIPDTQALPTSPT